MFKFLKIAIFLLACISACTFKCHGQEEFDNPTEPEAKDLDFLDDQLQGSEENLNQEIDNPDPENPYYNEPEPYPFKELTNVVPPPTEETVESFKPEIVEVKETPLATDTSSEREYYLQNQEPKKKLKVFKTVKTPEILEGHESLFDFPNALLSGSLVSCINPTFEATIGESVLINFRNFSKYPNLIRNQLFIVYLNDVPLTSSPIITIKDATDMKHIGGVTKFKCETEGRFILKFEINVLFGFGLKKAKKICFTQIVCNDIMFA